MQNASLPIPKAVQVLVILDSKDPLLWVDYDVSEHQEPLAIGV